MTSPLTLTNRDDLLEWTQHALTGQSATYYLGQLWLARAHRPPLLTADEELLAQACCSLYNNGYVHLYQQRQFPYEHRYYFIMRTDKRIGAYAHETGLLRRIIFDDIDRLSAEGKRCVPGDYVSEAGEGEGKGDGRRSRTARERGKGRTSGVAPEGGQEGEGRREEAEAAVAYIEMGQAYARNR